MAKITFSLTIDYDPAEHDGKPARIFLYQLLNRINNTEVKILKVGYKGAEFDAGVKKLSDMPFKKVDSLKEIDLPKAPKWLKNRTTLAPNINENVAKRISAGEKIVRTI